MVYWVLFDEEEKYFCGDNIRLVAPFHPLVVCNKKRGIGDRDELNIVECHFYSRVTLSVRDACELMIQWSRRVLTLY